jgi:hypothetical protein
VGVTQLYPSTAGLTAASLLSGSFRARLVDGLPAEQG